MAITWTKKFGPSDDGAVLTGAQLLQLQDDIDNSVSTTSVPNPASGDAGKLLTAKVDLSGYELTSPAEGLAIASQAEAEAGTDNTKVMTPLRVSQAVAVIPAAGIPIGGIMMWYGSTAAVPTGWGLCDGTTYTRTDGAGNIVSPNLSGRFIIAADGTYAVGATGDGTIPAHTHTITKSSPSGTDSGHVPTSNTLQSGVITTSSYGTGTAVIAKHYALAYIMKI